jgi:AraC family transcriptional regulator of arabinose operon
MPLKEDAAPLVAPLVAGYFQERRGYSTWRTRGTRDYLLMLTLSGAGRIGFTAKVGTTSPKVSGERIVQSGDIVLIRPNTRHDYGTARSADIWELLWAHFLPYPHWQEWLVWPEIAPETSGIGILTLSGEVRETVPACLWDMQRKASGGLMHREAFAMNALEEALLWCDSVNPRSGLDSRVEQTLHYLREHLGDPIALPELARRVDLSPSRLSHLFREQTGQTPGQFLEQERLVRAQQLLAFTSRPIAAIAAEVGFESPFYFTLRFRKYTGLSPRAFRQQHEERQESHR